MWSYPLDDAGAQVVDVDDGVTLISENNEMEARSKEDTIDDKGDDTLCTTNGA